MANRQQHTAGIKLQPTGGNVPKGGGGGGGGGTKIPYHSGLKMVNNNNNNGDETIDVDRSSTFPLSIFPATHLSPERGDDVVDYRRTMDATVLNVYWYLIVATIAPLCPIVYYNIGYLEGVLLSVLTAVLSGFSLLFDAIEGNPKKTQNELNALRRWRMTILRLSLMFFLALFLWIVVVMIQNKGALPV